nr:MAG: putative RNA-dependent RNA polymerase [Botourmiaviridae sp.]
MVVPLARSRFPRVKGTPSDNSASGSEVKRCRQCLRVTDETKQVVHNGLQLLRVRYGIPYCELPDCEVSELSRLLSFLLLQGKERPSVVFPRCQSKGKSIDGLCSLQRLCRRSRWELAHSMNSIKRNLPAGCKRHTPSKQNDWVRSACSQPPPPSVEYLEFVKREVSRLFPPCWDKRYGSFVGNHLPNPTARKPLLSRADMLWAGRRSEFITLTTSETDLAPLLEARYKEVMSAGKCRPLLIFDEKVDLLGPLHKLIYSHLGRFDWLLCGPPTDKRMESVCVREYQTSVDLVNATDGLRHDVAETILDALFFTSVKIPRSIRALAKASLSPVFKDSEGVHRRVRHGQMMGAYLSFPLLCLQSYLAARWAARFDASARFLVNGDDCVISASRGITVGDYPPGFRLNSDKTIVAENVVEVNSTAFLRSRGGWREVRHLRRGGAPTTSFAGMLHMADAVVKAGPSWVDAYQRARIGRRWGFLPSQIGHKTYVAWKRERQMSRKRNFTSLPSPESTQDMTSLVVIRGRDPTAIEAEALRSFFWENGRRGGLKRDVFSPSPGKVRRTYSYRARPCSSFVSYVCCRRVERLVARRGPVPGFFLLPEDFETEEEMRALDALACYRAGEHLDGCPHALAFEG